MLAGTRQISWYIDNHYYLAFTQRFFRPRRKAEALRDNAVHDPSVILSVRSFVRSSVRVSRMFPPVKNSHPLREIYGCGGGLLVAFFINAPHVFLSASLYVSKRGAY